MYKLQRYQIMCGLGPYWGGRQRLPSSTISPLPSLSLTVSRSFSLGIYARDTKTKQTASLISEKNLACFFKKAPLSLIIGNRSCNERGLRTLPLSLPHSLSPLIHELVKSRRVTRARARDMQMTAALSSSLPPKKSITLQILERDTTVSGCMCMCMGLRCVGAPILKMTSIRSVVRRVDLFRGEEEEGFSCAKWTERALAPTRTFVHTLSALFRAVECAAAAISRAEETR